jgi:radical SAM protein with 4Fe4S-binding SPASM domain
MTVSPYLNASYSLLSYGLRRFAGVFLTPPLPPAISVELSGVCNLSCPECMTGSGMLNRRNDYIDFEIAGKIASELSGRTQSVWLCFQGEPMLHPRFFDIVDLFRKMSPVISTNGHFLDGERCHMLAGSALKKVIISYDGVTSAAYNTYRAGGDHARVTEGIRLLAETVKFRKSPLSMEIQFLIGRHNEAEAKAAAQFAKSVNASFTIKSIQLLDPARAERWMPADKTKSRYEIRNGHYMPLMAPKRGCFRMWRGAVINTDGDVVPCCYDKNAGHVMGNLYDQSFKEIWYGERYRSFRNKILKSRTSVDICEQCPQGRVLFFRR